MSVIKSSGELSLCNKLRDVVWASVAAVGCLRLCSSWCLQFTPPPPPPTPNPPPITAPSTSPQSPQTVSPSLTAPKFCTLKITTTFQPCPPNLILVVDPKIQILITLFAILTSEYSSVSIQLQIDDKVFREWPAVWFSASSQWSLLPMQ